MREKARVKGPVKGIGLARSVLGGAISTLVNQLIPARCCLCLEISAEEYCTKCQAVLPWIDACCRQCGMPLACGDLCGLCQQALPAYQQVIVPFYYREPIASHIHQMKYQEKIGYARSLASMLAMTVIKRGGRLPQALVPIPLHPVRLRKRGYNQAGMLADALGEILNIPVRHDLLVRIRDTSSQTRLDEKSRKVNIYQAFSVNAPKKQDGIAVIDDVITSGTTMGEACGSLASAGYRDVSAWAIAKTEGLPLARATLSLCVV